MKLKKVSFYQTLFMMVLLLQIYLPSFKVNIFIQLVALGIYFILERTTISFRFLIILLPLIAISILGFLGLFIFENPLVLALKDIFHFIKPLLGILIGYLFFKTINDVKIFVRTIVTIGLVSAIVHIFIVLFFTNLASGSVHAIREFTKDNYLELIAIFFLGYYRFFFSDTLFENKGKSRIIFAIILISCILYFSRTMMVAAVLIALSVYGYTKFTVKSLRVLILVFLSIGLLYGYLHSVRIERDKAGLEAFLYKVKIAPEEIFKTKINREDHEKLWDHWRGYEAKRAFALMREKPLSFITGTGYGSLVNLKFYAPLSSDGKGLKYISELHNGYPYVFYKTGFFGLLFYLFFLVILYSLIYVRIQFETIFISALGLFYLFTTLTITGIYNTNDTTVFVLGALLFGYIKSSIRTQNND